MLLLKFKVTWSVSLIHWSVVLWRARKPNWLALSRPLSSKCLWTIFRITFSNSLRVADKRLIGRKFWVLTVLRQRYDVCFLLRLWKMGGVWIFRVSYKPSPRTTQLKKRRFFYCCVRVCWGSHVIATQPVHWGAGCCLATVAARITKKTLLLLLRVRLNVFTEPLPSSGHTRRNIHS
jgi:hypothetical protein